MILFVTFLTLLFLNLVLSLANFMDEDWDSIKFRLRHLLARLFKHGTEVRIGNTDDCKWAVSSFEFYIPDFLSKNDTRIYNDIMMEVNSHAARTATRCVNLARKLRGEQQFDSGQFPIPTLSPDEGEEILHYTAYRGEVSATRSPQEHGGLPVNRNPVFAPDVLRHIRTDSQPVSRMERPE